MNEKRLKLIHTVCGIVISAALIAAAICLIVSAYTIYKSGDKPYTPESIKTEYAKIAAPLWIAIFAVIAGIALNVALPLPEKRKKATNDPFVRLRILQKKLPEDYNHDGIARQRHVRKAYRAIFTALCIGSFAPAIISLFDYDFFTVANLSPALLRTVGLLSIGVIASGALLFTLSAIERKSAEREIEWTKVALSEKTKAENEAPVKKDNKAHFARFVLLGVACVLIVIGLTQNGFYDVLQKAIRICTECIGLG